MADKIRGITIELGADTSGLSKALKDVNSEISKTQKELRDVDKLLKLDPGNTELLQQKQKYLAEAIGETKRKLDTLREAQKQVAEGSDEWNAIQREIVSTEQNLKSLEQKMRDFGSVTAQQLKAAGKSVSEFGGKIEDAGKKLQPVSTAAAGALGGLVALGYKSVTAADDLNTLSKQTGIATDELQKMQYASDLVDVSVEDITGAMKKMKMNMDSSSSSVKAAWERIGVSVTNADGSMRNATDVFYDALEGLSQIENETERDQVAMDLFGKSADNLAGIIDDGGAALKQYGQEAQDMGLILSQDVIDNLNETNDKIDKAKATIGASFAELGAEVAEALVPVIDKTVEIIGMVTEKLRELEPEQAQTIMTILAVVAAVAPVLIIIGQVVAGIGSLISIIGAAVGAITTVIGVLGAPLLGVIAAAIAIGVLLYKNWDEIKAKAEQLYKAVQEKWEAIKKSISDAITAAQTAVTEKATAIKDAVVNTVTDAVEYLKDLPNQALAWGRDLISNFVDGIKEKFNAVKDTISDIAETVADFLGFSEPEKGALSDFHTFAPDMMQLYAQGIKDNMYLVTDELAKMSGAMAGAVNGRTANIQTTSNVVLDGRIIAQVVNRELGVML